MDKFHQVGGVFPSPSLPLSAAGVVAATTSRLGRLRNTLKHKNICGLEQQPGENGRQCVFFKKMS